MVILVKTLLASLLIGLASAISRRYGPAVGGWFAALPLTSGPLLLALTLERGPVFAAHACEGVLLALIGLSACILCYQRAAARGSHWTTCSAAACGAYLLCAWMLRDVSLPIAGAFALACAALLGTLRLMTEACGAPPPGLDRVDDISTDEVTRQQPSIVCTRRSGAAIVQVHGGSRTPTDAVSGSRALSRWEIPLRMLFAALFVSTLSAAAAAAGPRLSGLLAPFPVAVIVLAAATHRTDGADVAARLLRGLLSGLFAFALFFLVAGLTLTRWRISWAFTAATAAALLLHAGLRRRAHGVENARSCRAGTAAWIP